jgi:hypothetical protein
LSQKEDSQCLVTVESPVVCAYNLQPVLYGIFGMEKMDGKADLGHFLFFGWLNLGFGGHVLPLCKRDGHAIRIERPCGESRECGAEDGSE